MAGPPSYYHDASQIPIEQQSALLVKPMIADALGLLWGNRPQMLTEADHIKLFVFARSPDAFKLRCDGTGEEKSFVLYHMDVFKPED